MYIWGTRWLSCLRHCATSRKVEGSIPNGVIEYSFRPRTTALGLTQPLTEMSTRNISWGGGLKAAGADNLITFSCRLSLNQVASTSWNPQGQSRPVMGLLYLYTYIFYIHTHTHTHTYIYIYIYIYIYSFDYRTQRECLP